MEMIDILNIITAAVACYVFGGAWYMALSRPWVKAAGIETTAEGKPANPAGPIVHVMAFVAALLVAGVMDHVFMRAGIDSLMGGLMVGAGLGLFVASPWTMVNNGFAGRPFRLTLIDGGYATFGCIVIALVLVAF